MIPYLLLRSALLLFVWSFCLGPAQVAAEPKTRPAVRAKDRMLVPAGRAAGWELTAFDRPRPTDGTYVLRRRGRTKGQLESIAIFLSREKPTIPKAIFAMGDPKPHPVTLDQEVYIPALQRKVRFYQAEFGGGAENDSYRTEPIELPDGRGGTLYLVIEAESVETPPATMLTWIRWVPVKATARWKSRD